MNINDLTLNQQPYLAGTYENPHYEASASDKDGNDYLVKWDVLDSFDVRTSTDESDACDWDNPSSIERI